MWQAGRGARVRALRGVAGRPRRRAADRARQGVRAWPSLKPTDLHKRFGDQVVLQDLSLWRSRKGELSGIMGPNGAGKTTCFNVLTGRYRARPRHAYASPATTSPALPPRQIAPARHLALVPGR